MENFNGGLKNYWQSRRYVRIDGESGHRQPRRSRIVLGGGKRRKFWRIQISPKLKLFSKIRFSPKRILRKIRDGYVKMMMSFANSGAISGGFGYGGQAVNGFGRAPQLKEYDEKVIFQIYKSLLVQGLADGGGPRAQRLSNTLKAGSG